MGNSNSNSNSKKEGRSYDVINLYLAPKTSRFRLGKGDTVTMDGLGYTKCKRTGWGSFLTTFVMRNDHVVVVCSSQTLVTPGKKRKPVVWSTYLLSHDPYVVS